MVICRAYSPLAASVTTIAMLGVQRQRRSLLAMSTRPFVAIPDGASGLQDPPSYVIHAIPPAPCAAGANDTDTIVFELSAETADFGETHSKNGNGDCFAAGLVAAYHSACSITEIALPGHLLCARR
jgi:hypothetical protein